MTALKSLVEQLEAVAATLEFQGTWQVSAKVVREAAAQLSRRDQPVGQEEVQNCIDNIRKVTTWPASEQYSDEANRARLARAADLLSSLSRQLVDVKARHTANHDAWLDEVVRLKRELARAQDCARDAEPIKGCIQVEPHAFAHIVLKSDPCVGIPVYFSVWPIAAIAARSGEGK
jgi:hypothetical protein